MQKLQFKVEINAPVAKVYNLMLGLDNKQSYEEWTAAFNPTSTYEGSWLKGSKILFIGTAEDGKRGGMVAEIAENIPNQFVSIHHRGILDGDQEIAIEAWASGFENYIFEELGNSSLVTIDADMPEEYLDYMNEVWPKALARLKELAEN
ncbi:MAG: SRPBCC domain-containing protein [Neisseriales bacterium]|nr:MAG: SRPBCC domain-containing protein [Neisseriales bacterium]